MLKKVMLFVLLIGCASRVLTDPWNMTPHGHLVAAKKSREDAQLLKKTMRKSCYRRVLVNIHNKEATLHEALADVASITDKTKRAEKRRGIQADFGALSRLHSRGKQLVKDGASKDMHSTMARAAKRVPGFGAASQSSQLGAFSID